jgi:hypothetical protein
MNTPSVISHKGPHTGMLALLYTILFCAGLYPVTIFYKQPYWPGPWEPASVIVSYFQNNGSRVLFCIVMQTGALVCFGLFAVTIVSRLRFLGARAAGTYIALLGGVLVLANTFVAAMATWSMIHPGIVDHAPTLLALYYFSFGLGGPGFSVPMGLFLAGVSVTAGFMRLLPRWLVIFGVVLAFAGELSLLHLAFPKLLFLIPLVRFPGFIWLIATGFLLPKKRMESADHTF